MQNLIKLKLIGLGHNTDGYNNLGYMDWLNEKNNITFITLSKYIDYRKLTKNSRLNFIIPGITSFEHYKIIENILGGLPIAIESNEFDFIHWLNAMDFNNLLLNYNIEFYQDFWIIFSRNHEKVINISKSEKLLKNKKLIKIKKLKI
jgi:hypothetical protein